MIAHQLALVKREIWEHRAIWLTPTVIGLIVCLVTLTGQTTISHFGEGVDIAIAGASNAGDIPLRAALLGALSAITAVFALGAGVVMIFYTLDALYSERKDKSILFWRSLPITDAETVISKMLTAFIAIPLATLAVTFLTHLASMILSSIWIMAEGGNAMHLIWRPLPLADAWGSSIIIAFAATIWFSPFFGWFLFVSAYTRRSPLLMGFLPLIVLPLVEIALLPTKLLATAIGERLSGMPLKGVNLSFPFDENDWPNMSDVNVSLFEALDVSRFVSSIDVWLGMVVCGLFVTAAIYVRRYKDES